MILSSVPYGAHMSTEITVRGSFSAFQAPERATVHISIAYEGKAMEPVYERVAQDLGTVKASIDKLKRLDPSPVTWWSAEQLRTWSDRPWNKDGKTVPLVHHAAVGVRVKFCEFGEMSAWIGRRVAGTEGFRVSNINWALTEKRRSELLREVRTRAVRDAVERAQQYCDALGSGTVRAVAIADAGMLGDNLRPNEGGGPAYLRAGAAVAGGASLELVPEDIEISAAVDARFVIDG